MKSRTAKESTQNVVGFVEAIEGDTAHFVVLELSSCSLADRMSEVRKLGTLMDRVVLFSSPLHVVLSLLGHWLLVWFVVDDVQKVFRIVQDVLAGLGFLHSRNEVYGDVKPSNILIGVDGTAKLGDFEEWLESDSKDVECGGVWDDAVLGPEMFVLGGNVGSVSQAGDMWAFGLIVLELLTGKAWISGQNAVEIAESVKRFDVQAVCRQATIPNTVEPLLCFLLSKNPLERLSSAELIRSGRLRSILGEETPLSHFIREELDSTIVTLEKEKDQIQHIVEDQSKTIALQKELLADVPIWVGTKSLQTLDRTVHSLTPTTLTQLFRFERQCRTAFTRPIDMGEWELKIKASKNTFVNMSLGFVRYPLPENATQRSCGGWVDGIGGDFILWNGAMLKSGKFKPPGTNKKWERGGQTAAIRVNMWTREARLFVDDEEQPGIFTDIPSPLCLAITTGGRIKSVEVLWLKRRRESDELERAALEERRIQKSQINEMKQHFADHSIWFGTEALQTLDRTAHTLTPTTLTQIINLEQGVTWRTAFTRRIDEGEWELKIRAMLGFLQHPLPEDATQETCGSWTNGFGGEFTLWDGRMWTNDEEFKPEGTNKICDRIGDIAAIRVNMRTREARLFVDDEEQGDPANEGYEKNDDDGLECIEGSLDSSYASQHMYSLCASPHPIRRRLTTLHLRLLLRLFFFHARLRRNVRLRLRSHSSVCTSQSATAALLTTMHDAVVSAVGKEKVSERVMGEERVPSKLSTTTTISPVTASPTSISNVACVDKSERREEDIRACSDEQRRSVFG
ncbi:putative Protein kinase domain containing protein [Blattamonas nauphoetae]|uniref:Protein kinase domain-containing protein n=1 Tax=Blattamonas nauphoetae TaxID=2049346 RepID=A0ABQ9WK48_9EUKA|nr:putative Protein kinase domain containing protein [Blattamonas nauphoetae]